MVHRLGGAALAAAACTLAVAVLAPGGAGAEPARSAQGLTVSLGNVLGGLTSQGFPVVLEIRGALRVNRVVRTTAALRLTCSAGGGLTVPDTYANVVVNKRRRFRASFGPETLRHDDGTTTVLQGSVGGSFNRQRTNASGTWQLQATDRDAAGAITDTCDSGRVTWRAKQ